MVIEFLLLFWTKQSESYGLIKDLEFVKSFGELLKLVQTTCHHILDTDNYYVNKVHSGDV